MSSAGDHLEPPELPIDAAGATEFAQLQAERDQANDRLLRLQAEMENVRKRARRELEDELKYAQLPLVRELLSVVDNVQRAIEAGEKTHDVDKLLEGVKLVSQQLQTVLSRHDTKPIDALGQPFDPNFHQAILQQPSDKPAGTVLTVAQPGYTLHDRVVRPSQVIVAAPPTDGAR